MSRQAAIDAQRVDDRLLDGVTVVSTAVNLPGPLAASRLCSWGARVTKIEPPAGDAFANISPEWYGRLIAGQDVRRLVGRQRRRVRRSDEVRIDTLRRVSRRRHSRIQHL